MATPKYIAENAWRKCEKINGELLVATYGALVASLLQKHGAENTNTILHEIGVDMGERLVEEFFCQTKLQFENTLEKIATHIGEIAFKMFMDITPSVEVNEANNTFTLTIEDNPLAMFARLPDEIKDTPLIYCNVYCGAIVGALHSLDVDSSCHIEKCTTRGDDTTQITVQIKK
ncbi:MAG: TRAPP complex subunit Bet3 [Amphiamblys sp. WSBS2006]|nr:MAG: TRAPP complex subunit Bet3 [Amphiamblys sp. WSBS2006]